MYIGTVLKNIREEQGFSLLEIQKKTGIKESQLCRIESGIRFPTDDQIFILAKFYNTSVDFLLDLTDEQMPYPRKYNKKE